MIKAIVFDCFGVLTTDIWLAFCNSLPPEADIAQASAINRAFDKGLISHDEYVSGVQDAVGSPPPSLDDLQENQIVKNQPLLDFIAALKPKYKIAILSNISDDWITRVLLNKEDQGLFDTIVQSNDVGLAKPDTEIFALTCERLGVSPEEAIMVDDRPRNVTGAIEAGLKGLIYEDFNRFKTELTALLDTNN